MRLSDCKCTLLLPLFMQSDIFDTTLCESIDLIVKDMWLRIQDRLSFWNYIDFMSEKQLDECATELSVYWYRYDVSVDAKRAIIKNAREVKRKLGTVWAVQEVLKIYFGEANVIEYWDYGGKKKHFKVQTWNSETVNEDAEMFLSILDKIKRKACVLDYIEVLEKSTNELLYIITPGQAGVTENSQIGGNV